MVQHGRVELLAHPLSQKYLQMKWNSYGKYFHIAHLLLFSVFLMLVTMFPSQIMNNLPYNIQEYSDGNCSIPRCIENCGSLTFQRNSSEFCSAALILVYVLSNVVREIFQLVQKRWEYVLDPSNFVSICLYTSAFIMVIPAITGETEGCADLQLSCTSITVFLSWFSLLLNLQRFDMVGIYVVMFLEILQTLLKVLVVFSILIIAFGLSFYILLSNGGHLSFRSMWLSLMRTFSMMLGEIDFVASYVQPLFPDEYVEKDQKTPPHLPLPFTTYFILGLFMVLMPILLMNLLIGLAVGDIESVRRNAQLKRLAMQVVLHTELERKVPQFFLERVHKTELIVYPNENKGKLGFMDQILRMWLCNPFSEDGLDMVFEGEDYVSEEMAKMKIKLKEINKTLDSQFQLMKLIVQPCWAAIQQDRHILRWINQEILQRCNRHLAEILHRSWKTPVPQSTLTDPWPNIQNLHALNFITNEKMEIKTEADEVDEGVSPKELKGTSNPGTKWTSPRVRNKLRSALSFSKNTPTR